MNRVKGIMGPKGRLFETVTRGRLCVMYDRGYTRPVFTLAVVDHPHRYARRLRQVHTPCLCGLGRSHAV